MDDAFLYTNLVTHVVWAILFALSFKKLCALHFMGPAIFLIQTTYVFIRLEEMIEEHGEIQDTEKRS